jgi:hypothetical protein
VCYICSDVSIYCSDCWHKTGKILKYLLYPKRPYPLHLQLLAALYRAWLQVSAGLLLISPNYWIWRMWILACTWTVALRSVTAYLSIFLQRAYLFSFAPRPLLSKTLKLIRELVIIQVKKLNMKPFLTLKVEHRNFYNDPNML